MTTPPRSPSSSKRCSRRTGRSCPSRRRSRRAPSRARRRSRGGGRTPSVAYLLARPGFSRRQPARCWRSAPVLMPRERGSPCLRLQSRRPRHRARPNRVPRPSRRPRERVQQPTIAPAAAPHVRRVVGKTHTATGLPTNEELQLLRAAREDVTRGDFARALAVLSEHARRFRNGVLVEEREALRVKSLAGLGRREEAQRAAANFHARFPHSVLLATFERMKESDR